MSAKDAEGKLIIQPDHTVLSVGVDNQSGVVGWRQGSTESRPAIVAILENFHTGVNLSLARHSYYQELTGITANGAQAAIDMTDCPMSKFTMVVDRTAGATDVVEIDLEASLDGTLWFQIATITSLATDPNRVSVVDEPWRHFRANVVDVGAGNTLTTQILASSR